MSKERDGGRREAQSELQYDMPADPTKLGKRSTMENPVKEDTPRPSARFGTCTFNDTHALEDEYYGSNRRQYMDPPQRLPSAPALETEVSPATQGLQ